MSVQGTETDAGRSLFGEALHWALPRLAVYALAALGSVVAFTVWAVVYTYVWPGKPTEVSPPPSPITGAPPRARVPVERDEPGQQGPPMASAPVAVIPSDALTILQLRKLHVVNLNNERIGEIEDVVFSPDGQIYAYVVSVGGFLGGPGKDIAVPVHEVQFKKTDNSDGHLILNMSKDAVRSAPQFEYGKMKWGEGNWKLTPPGSAR